MERTGHRSTDGVRAYKRSSEKLKELSSNVLNRCEKKARSEKTTCSDPPVSVAGDENKPASTTCSDPPAGVENKPASHDVSNK